MKLSTQDLVSLLLFSSLLELKAGGGIQWQEELEIGNKHRSVIKWNETHQFATECSGTQLAFCSGFILQIYKNGIIIKFNDQTQAKQGL